MSWSAKKQQTVSRSSTEAEYRALAEAAAEIAWISSLLKDLHISQPSTPILYCDNLSAVYLTANPVLHKRTKHIDVDYHFTREKVALGSLEVKHVPASAQLADIFTKSLPQAAFTYLRTKLGVVPGPTQSLKGGDRGHNSETSKSLSVVNTPSQAEGFKHILADRTNESGPSSTKPTSHFKLPTKCSPAKDKTVSWQKKKAEDQKQSTTPQMMTSNRFAVLTSTADSV